MNQLKKIKKNKENFNIQMPLILSMIVICALIVLTIMFLPLINSIFSKRSFLDSFTSLLVVTNDLGGTIGGLLGPIVALLAALLTYWAFMEQVKANRKQAKQFKKQFSDQQNSKFESRFFELLKIHIEHRDRFNNLFPKNDGFAEILKELKFLHNIFEITYKQENINFYSNVFYENINLLPYNSRLEVYKNEIYEIMNIVLFGFKQRDLINQDNKTFISALSMIEKEEHDFFLPENDLIRTRNNCLFLKCNDLDYNESMDKVSLIIDSNPYALNGYLKILSPYFSTLRLLFSSISNNKYLNMEEKRNYYYIINSMFSNNELSFLYFYFVRGFEPLFSKKEIFDSVLFYELDTDNVGLLIDYYSPADYFSELYSEFDDNFIKENFFRKI